MDKYVGKRIDGRYEIKEIIGVGGMAVVYKAFDSIDNRLVAIKILKDELLSDEDFRRRFKNESKAIALLSHPNIVRVLDVSFGDKIQYYVMEYIDGITLKEYISRQGVIKWKEALYFSMQILRALQHAHDKGIVHRDIKPQNIMLLADGSLKVTDFGIARFSRMQQRTITDKAIGSVHYISPEQARGDVTDEKSDLYSVGVLIYEMITGKLPFDADSAVSVAIMQMQNTPKKPHEINPEIPLGFEQIVIKAMQKNPNSRYQSAAEMLSDIETLKENQFATFDYQYFVDDEPTKYIPISNTTPTTDIVEDEYDDEEDDNDSEDDNKKSKFVPMLVGICIAFVVGLIAVGIFVTGPSVFGLWGQNKDDAEACPDLIGLDYNTIINDSAYKQYNISIKKTKNDYSSEYESGEIIWQSPEAGKTIKGKKEIEVAVSLGPKLIVIQDYQNYEKTTVVKSLKNYGLTNYVFEEVYSDDVAVGFVVRTDPVAGNSVSVDDKITIYVSKGAVPQTVNVPSYVGLSLADAKRQLVDNGLAVGSVTEKYSNEYPAGYVIAQSVNAGSTVQKGSYVGLTISLGKAPASSVASVNESTTSKTTSGTTSTSSKVESNTTSTSSKTDEKENSSATTSVTSKDKE